MLRDICNVSHVDEVRGGKGPGNSAFCTSLNQPTNDCLENPTMNEDDEDVYFLLNIWGFSSIENMVIFQPVMLVLRGVSAFTQNILGKMLTTNSST